MFTKQQLETALDAGKLRCRMPNGNLWSCRRNGATQLWKTRPSEFRIPIKIGYRTYGEITQYCLDDDEELVIVD